MTRPSSALAAVGRRMGTDDDGQSPLTRPLALAAVLVALSTSLGVMWRFHDVTGGTATFVAVVAASLLAATAAARYVRPAVAGVLATAALVAGLWWYLGQLPRSPPLAALATDSVELVAGHSLLRIDAVRAWALGVAPAPAFLTWYLALRRRYVLAVLVAGGTLAFFVLTTDAGALTTLTGVVAATAAVGLGDAERRGDSLGRLEPVAVVVAVMIVVPAVVSVVPASAAGGPFEGGAGTVEASLVDVDERVSVEGSIDLSPATRFTVEADRPAYWRVGSFGRYSGDGWVRTGGSRAYDGGRLERPPGPTRRLNQRYRVTGETSALPAAWKPVDLAGVTDAEVRSDGGFAPTGRLANGTTYTVESRVPAADERTLRAVDEAAPPAVRQRYTQLPSSTPDRLERRTSRLTANAETPYEQALVVERWLETTKNYSLQVRKPRDDVADTFVFEMDAGYCTYFATAMVAMLRTQDVPARFVVGYTPGERVADDRWVVRGYDAHAWVEVYVNGHGWVRFDPTPAGPREAAERDSLSTARERNRTDVDTAGSSTPGEWTPTSAPTPAPVTPRQTDSGESNGSNGTLTVPEGIITGTIRDQPNLTATATPTETGTSTPAPGPRLPSRQELALAFLAAGGLALAVRRSGLAQRAYRGLWIRYQPRRDPETDVERAFDRLVVHLERTNDTARRPTETAREFLDRVDADDRARQVLAVRERARYAGRVSRVAANDAVELVDDIVR